MTMAMYHVSGMTCEHCARAVSAELKQLSGVSDVTVDLVPGGVSAVTVSSEEPLAGQAVAAAGRPRRGGREWDNESPRKTASRSTPVAYR
jgi:copper chaperone